MDITTVELKDFISDHNVLQNQPISGCMTGVDHVGHVSAAEIYYSVGSSWGEIIELTVPYMSSGELDKP